MNGWTFKVPHWHIITWIHFIVSDDSFERLPCIILIQHQVRRTLKRLWGISPMRSFSWRGKILRLDGWNGLDGCHVNHWVVQIYYWRSEIWDLRKRVLLGFCFLRPRRLGRSPRSTELDIVFLFLVWTVGFWTTEGVVSSWIWTSSSPLVAVFSLFSIMVAIPMTKKTKLKKEKEKRKKDGRYLLSRIVSKIEKYF